MPEHASVSCPNCHNNLWVRIPNLGRKGYCKYCGHLFRAEAAARAEAPADPHDPVSLGDEPGAPLRRPDAPKGTRPGVPAREPSVSEWEEVNLVFLGPGEEEALWPDEPDQAAPPAPGPRPEGSEVERLRALLREARSRSVPAERPAGDPPDDPGRLARERDEALAQRDALAADLARLRDERDELQQLRDEAELEATMARDHCEALERDRESGWQRQRGELLAEAERRLAEQRERFEAERDAWRRERDDHAGLAAEWETLAREVAEFQASLLAERDALAREVKQLRARLDADETAHPVDTPELEYESPHAPGG